MHMNKQADKPRQTITVKTGGLTVVDPEAVAEDNTTEVTNDVGE